MTTTSGLGDARSTDTVRLSETVGPVIFYRDLAAGRLSAVAVIAVPAPMAAPRVVADGVVVTPQQLDGAFGVVIWGYPIDLPASGGTYYVHGQAYELAGISEGDLRIGYVACNGVEHGDHDRPLAQRNALWSRLAGDHDSEPFNLLLHGGDQLYADEMLDTHPALRRWQRGIIDHDVDTDEVVDCLRAFLLERYLALYSQPEPAWLMARVPSLCMWDDHDICDGWGSLTEAQLDSPVGRTVFSVARALYLVFQCGSAPDQTPPASPDRAGRSLGWHVELPGVSIVAPDLRSERRPHAVMGEAGWRAFDEALAQVRGQHVFVISSVPALGPRLSWVERLMHVMPGIQKYEDDLRDQWQSRWHRAEWQRFLSSLASCHEGRAPVTVLSGEIHLATRGTMRAEPDVMHQLVASGISHPAPPRPYAWALGSLARLGESPLPGRGIRLYPVPGHRCVYATQRNYLVLARRAGRWWAYWQLEHDGPTPELALSADNA